MTNSGLPNQTIPEYAYDHLWINDNKILIVSNELIVPQAAEYTLYWGSPQGPILGYFTQPEDILSWQGTIQVGGYIDAIYTTMTNMSMLYVGGKPLKQDYITSGINRPAFHDGLEEYVLDTTITTWLLPNDSPLMQTIHHALIHNLRIYCHGHLAEGETDWEKQFNLPLVLKSVTMFAP